MKNDNAEMRLHEATARCTVCRSKVSAAQSKLRRLKLDEADDDVIEEQEEVLAVAVAKWEASTGMIAVTIPAGATGSPKRLCFEHAGIEMTAKQKAAMQKRTQELLHRANAPWRGSSLRGTKTTSTTGDAAGRKVTPEFTNERVSRNGFPRQRIPYADTRQYEGSKPKQLDDKVERTFRRDNEKQ